MKPLVVLEMNEINYNYVQTYIEQGRLKNFKRFFTQHGFTRTTSETSYEILEPWIQWVSARTGKSYAEHQVFRLGDIVSSDAPQHWEVLEEKGYKVGAVSPINAVNRTKRSPFWVPDPWVDTHTSGDEFLEKLTAAVKQAVNDNASEALSAQTKRVLIQALLTKSKVTSWPCYVAGVFGALKKQHWSKAIVLDRLLADVFFKLWRAHKPDFSTLFLNSGAHIQHHYLFNSKAYNGDQKNPEWYVDPKADPVLEIYELYDAILGEAINLNARIMVGTGLQQMPYEEVTFYYRLVNHDAFLANLGVAYERILPRMSRDFLIECADTDAANTAGELVAGLRAADGSSVFSVDNRGDTLFVTLTFPHEITQGFKLFDQHGSEVLGDLHKEVAFVAIKNGHHDAVGYFMDTAFSHGELPESIPLEDIYHRVMDHFDGSRVHTLSDAHGTPRRSDLSSVAPESASQASRVRG